ncbi:glycosyltransferase, partial [Methylobacterium sp. WL7]|uniref:glycosyltransferase n=1 Tax=Methylobacterium sp. WL7 TaxID=2603900 RepID=UPI0011C9822A
MSLDNIDRASTLISQANECADHKRYEEAKKILQEIFASYEDTSAAYALMIKIEKDLNNIHGAIILAQEALRKFPENEYMLLDLGWMYFTAGVDARAVECSATLIANPTLTLSMAGRRLLIFILARSKKWKDAAAHFALLEDQDQVFCSTVAREVAPTFQGTIVKMLADGRIQSAYELLEILPPQIAPELARIIDHLAVNPSKLPRQYKRFHPRRLLNPFYRIAQKRQLNFSNENVLRGDMLPHTSPRPKVSVITPVLNGAKTIRSTIESVLQQADVELEYIIIDGGSTDETLSIISEYADQINVIVSEKDKGLYDAVRKGFDLATGDIYCYLNASDTFERAALSRVVSAFLKNPGYEVIYFDETLDYGVWKTQNKRQPEVGFATLWQGHILFQASVFFTKRAYLFVGGINRSLRLAGDSELWLRLSYRFSFKYCQGHVSTSSVHDGQLSEDMVAYYGELIKIRQSFAEVLTTFDWLRVGLQGKMKKAGRYLSVFSAYERRYRRLLFPFVPMNVNGLAVIETSPDYDICPVLQTPLSVFVASILCPDQ